MDQLIELLKQIQELAGVGVEALSDASKGKKESPSEDRPEGGNESGPAHEAPGGGEAPPPGPPRQ